MPELFVFLLKVNIALLLFCAGYYMVLRHLTFYTLNRIYLIGAILFATAYPFINLNGFAQRHRQLARPVQVVLSIQAPAQILVKPLNQPMYWRYAEILFFAGAAFLAIRLLMQLFSLYKVYRDSHSGEVLGHSVRVIDGDGGPFSFWKNIYVNPSSYNDNDLRAILQHEQIHTDELHTLDILLAELSIIFYWFNPGVWLMRRAVRENIEFITDRKILQKGIDSKKYQYSLLNVSFSASQQGIANHFNISTLKKRIIMMNAKRSSKVNLTRYALLVPVLLICLFAFSFSKAELVKKSKTSYKVFFSSVATITKEAAVRLDAKYVTELFEQKETPKTINAISLTDTNKIAIYDTTKKISISSSNFMVPVIINARYNAKGDTNKIKYLTPTVIVDGVNIGELNVNTLSPGAIKSIQVIRDKNSPQNSQGVVLVTTNNNNNPNYKATYGSQLPGTYTVNNPNIDTVALRHPALIIVDSKEAKQGVSNIVPNDIESYDIYNGTNADMLKKYGDKAKYGVIIITLKKP